MQADKNSKTIVFMLGYAIYTGEVEHQNIDNRMYCTLLVIENGVIFLLFLGLLWVDDQELISKITPKNMV